jgi:hypothetical protein
MLDEEGAEGGQADDYDGDHGFYELPVQFPYDVDCTGVGDVDSGDLDDYDCDYYG